MEAKTRDLGPDQAQAEQNLTLAASFSPTIWDDPSLILMSSLTVLDTGKQPAGDLMKYSPLSRSEQTGLSSFLANNSLSIALFGLFTVCVVAQANVGWGSYNESLSASDYASIGFWTYLRTGTFLNGMFSNWQAAFLQLSVLVAFSTVLRQRGAAHSRKGDDEPHNPGRLESRPEIKSVRRENKPPAPENRRQNNAGSHLDPTRNNWLYDNSLSLVMFGLFSLCFALHAETSNLAYNEEQTLRHLPPAPLISYLHSATFWFNSFQTWEAEFLAIGVYIILTIFLRQDRSPESKQVGCSDETTGDTNE